MKIFSKHDWKNLPVWRCSSDECSGKQWASWHHEAVCPFCDIAPVERTGFTCGDVADAADKFGFEGDLPIHIPEPVPELVQLPTLPQDLWIGLPVFHPMSQTGSQPNWLFYDVGVVVDVLPDHDFPERLQCRFLYSDQVSLRYSPDILWVPKALAERLT